MNLKQAFQEYFNNIADAREALPCPLPEEWHAYALSLKHFSRSQQEHVNSCASCKRTEAQWKWAFKHPLLSDLLRWKGSRLSELEQFAVGLHVDERMCVHCQSIVSSPWFRCLRASIEQGRRTVEEVVPFLDRRQPLFDGAAGLARAVPMPATSNAAFASAKDHAGFMTCLGDDTLRVVVSNRNGQQYLCFEHPDPPDASILKVNLVGEDDDGSYSQYVMLYPWRSDSPAGVGELLLNSVDSASPPVVIPVFQHIADLSAADADELLESALSARENDPAALPFWKILCKQVIASRRDVEPKLLSCLETIVNLDSHKPTAVFSSVAKSAASVLSPWEKLALLSRVSTPRDEFGDAFESLRELTCPRSSQSNPYRTDGYELDNACRMAVSSRDEETLSCVWKHLEFGSLPKGLSHYFTSSHVYKQKCASPVRYLNVLSGLKAPVAAARAILAFQSSRWDDLYSWVGETFSACTGKQIDRREIVTGNSVIRERATSLDGYLKSLSGDLTVGATRDLVDELLGKERRVIRCLNVALPAVSGQSGSPCCFHIELVENGTGEFYADPVTMRLYPQCADFCDAMALAWRAANISSDRRKDLDTRWSINADLPVLSGTSLGGLVALSIIDIFNGTSGDASWTMSASIADETGRLVSVESIAEKVKAVIDRRLRYVIVHKDDASNARQAALQRMAQKGCVRPVETLAEAEKLIRRPSRLLWFLLALAATVLLCALPSAAAFVLSRGTGGETGGNQVTTTVVPPVDDVISGLRKKYKPGVGSPKGTELISPSTPPILSSQDGPSVQGPVILNAARANGLTNGIDYGVFYNDEVLPDNQFAHLWKVPQPVPYWNMYYNVREHHSFVGLWIKTGNSDWSRYVNGELVIRCRRIGELREMPLVFEGPDSEVPQTECASRIKVEVKLNKLDAGGEENLKSELYVELPESAGSQFVDVRVPLAKFRRVIGYLNGYEGEKIGVFEVALVFENRKLGELNPAPLTSNFGVQAIVLTESLGQDVDQVLANHAGSVETRVDLIATPSGFMGDLGEAAVESENGAKLDGIRAMGGQDGGTRFVFVATGKGPYEWDSKYVRNGQLNPNAANFGGCCYLNPSNNWGEHQGTDLRELHPTKIVWEARKTGENDCVVEFFIGSNSFVWQEEEGGIGHKVTPEYPESLSRLGLRNQVMTPAGPETVSLSKDWQTFYEDLSFKENDPRLANVISLFGWIVRDPNADLKEYEFEVRNIRFVRE